MAALRHRELWGSGGYLDIYSDAYTTYSDALYIENVKQRKSFYPDDVQVSSVFEADADLEEFPDIWAAVATVWTNRGTYETVAGLKTAINAALTTAGYTGPGGGSL